MADNVSPARRSEIMQAVRSRDTSLERMVRRALWRKGVRFRVNVNDLPGKPDIAIKRLKLAIFIDSCFWHGCPEHGRIPKSNVDFWKKKINKNMERDKEVADQYRKMGWRMVRIWEHDLRNRFDEAIDCLLTAIRSTGEENCCLTIDPGSQRKS